MMNNKMKDERTVQLNHMIQSEAYMLTIFLLGISVFVKGYVMDLTVSHYIAELAVMIISAFYTVVRGTFVGYDSMEEFRYGRKTKILFVLGLSILVSVVNGVRNYTLYGEHYSGVFDGKFIAVLAITFISCLIFLTIIFALMSGLNAVGQKRLEKEMEEDE